MRILTCIPRTLNPAKECLVSKTTKLRSVLALGAACFLAVLFCEPVDGQAPSPPPGVSGYTVTVDDSWGMSSQGFYPIRVTVETNPAIAAANDETFSVSIRFNNYDSTSYLVSTAITIASGSKSATAELYLSSVASQNSYGNVLLVEKGEFDGRFNKRQDLLQASIQRTNIDSSIPTQLLISSTFSVPQQKRWTCYQDNIIAVATVPSSYESAKPLPSFDEQDALFHEDTQAISQGIKKAKTAPSFYLNQSLNLSGIHPKYLPQHWIGFSSVEQILISKNDLKTICRSQEISRANLERWVAAGGVLIVFDTPTQTENELLPMLLGPERSVLGNRIKSQWSTPKPENKTPKKPVAKPLIGDEYGEYDYQYENEYLEQVELIQSPTLPSAANFGYTAYLNGKIVAIQDDMSQWTSDQWKTLQSSVYYQTVSIHDRIGPSTGAQPYRFMSIPGVGVPPVKLFIVLISLFICIAGPVLLLVLKKTHQMQYLFVAVPALSLGVCGALLSYAFITDSGNSWGRSQSITVLDHRTNMAVTHARANYYGGNSPKPYRTEMDTLLLAGKGKSSGNLTTRFGQDVYESTAADMKPRTPHESVSIRSHEAQQRLQLTKSSIGGPPSVTNLLGGLVKFATITTDEGWFFIENLPPNETVVCQPSNTPTLQSKLASQLRRQSPKAQSQSFAYDYDYWDPDWGDEITIVLEMFDYASSEVFLEAPQTYIAVLEEFPLAAQQLKDVEYKAQLHVVRGQW